MKAKAVKGRAVLKKWGGSLGLVIPKDAAAELELRAGSEVEFEVRLAPLRVRDIQGLFKEEMKDFDWKMLDRELARGWHE